MCFIIRGVIRVQQDVLKGREKEIEKRGGFIFCGWEFCTLISGMLEDSEGKMFLCKNLDECGNFVFRELKFFFLLDL